MASTYPLEVVEAERWVGKNKNLKGDQLKEALEKQSWDDSVKTLTATSQDDAAKDDSHPRRVRGHLPADQR